VAKQESNNNLSNSGAAIVAGMIGVKILAGWTVVSYGTGTAGSYSSTGAGYTSAVLGADCSWVRTRAPDGEQECIFQCQLSGGFTNSWRIKTSALARFVGGAPNANTVPSATDEKLEFGSGTDAAPGYGGLINIGGAIVARWSSIADDVPVNGIYHFNLVAHTQGTTAIQTIIVNDPMIAGSQDANDANPCAFVIVGNGSSSVKWWAGYGDGAAAIQTQTIATAQLGYAGTQSRPPGSTSDQIGRFSYYTATYPKGLGFGFALKAIARAHPNVADVAGDRYAYVGGAVAGYLVRCSDTVDPIL
jgi:hypothetical protein